MKTVVTGSLAYDYIMSFPGYFKDHILQDKAHMLTVSFLVDSMKKMRGGVAGNIAYSLALLGTRPQVVATAGTDFRDYREWMEARGVDTSGIIQIDGEFTASCFINTDKANNQIVAFYAGAMAQAHRLSLEGLGLGQDDLVVISPTDPESMRKCVQDCKKLGVPYLFDPGKQTPRLDAATLLEGIQGAAVLIGNDYEFAMMAKKTERTEAELIQAAPLTVITKGEQGSTLYRRGEAPLDIPVAAVASIEDPTGAGDAYLGGLVFGLQHKLPLATCGRIGALAAAFVIERRGCQEHSYTRPEFLARYRKSFGEAKELERLFL